MSRPIHVLELRSVRGTGGGPEKTILLGARRIDRAQFAITVCYIRDARDNSFGLDQRPERRDVEYVEIVERSSFDPRIWPALRRLVRDRAIDIVHAHDYKTDLLARLLALAEGTIPLATAHGWTGHSRRERFFYYPLDQRLLSAFPITIAVSEQIRSVLVRQGARADRVRVILNGIDHHVFRRDRSREARERRHLGIAPGDLVVGAIGRLEPQKRFDLLIQACAELSHRWPTLRVLIAGDGSLRNDLKALAARLLPEPRCQLLGHRSDIPALHHAFNLLVQASDYEGTPNAVLEAMALETPIIATAVGGTAEVAPDGTHALLVPPRDVGALARAIERALAQPGETEGRVVRARRRIETVLSFDRRMAAVENIYRELVEGRTGRKDWTAA